MITQLIAICIQGEEGYALIWVSKIPNLSDQKIGVSIVSVLGNHFSSGISLVGKFFIAND